MVANNVSCKVPVIIDWVLCPQADPNQPFEVGEAVAVITGCEVCEDKTLVTGVVEKPVTYAPLNPIEDCPIVTTVASAEFACCIEGDTCDLTPGVQCEIDEFRRGGRIFHSVLCLEMTPVGNVCIDQSGEQERGVINESA